jgi:hypothetical protein
MAFISLPAFRKITAAAWWLFLTGHLAYDNLHAWRLGRGLNEKGRRFMRYCSDIRKRRYSCTFSSGCSFHELWWKVNISIAGKVFSMKLAICMPWRRLVSLLVIDPGLCATHHVGPFQKASILLALVSFCNWSLK